MSPPVEILRIGPDTAGPLARVAPDVFDRRIDAARLAGFLTGPDRALLVAVSGGVVIGQIRAHRIHHPDAAPDLLIENLGVTPAWRRRGVATRLAAAARALAADWGCAGFYVLTEAENETARAFYRALGWRESDVAMFDAGPAG